MAKIATFFGGIWRALRATSRTAQLDRLSPEAQAQYLASRDRTVF